VQHTVCLKDGGSTSFQNVGKFLQDYMTAHPIRQ